MGLEQKIIKVISSVEKYDFLQKSFKTTFPNQPTITKAIEVFDDVINELLDSVFDLIEMEDKEVSSKYEKENWTRSVCKNLIYHAAKYPEFKQSAAELVSDWENLSTYTGRIDSHTWFYYYDLLEEHQTGYKEWHKKQRKLKETETE